MVATQQAPSGTDRRTNSLAVVALTLALLPTLAATVVVVVMADADYELRRGLHMTGALDFLAYGIIWGFVPFLLSVIAFFRRPGTLSRMALAVAFVNLFYLNLLFYITPKGIH